MNTDFDVIIVGARVAGSMTALHLARSGQRVLVVDRVGPPSDTVSTHILMRTAVLQLKKAGILDRLVDNGTPSIRRMTLGFGPELVQFDLREAYGVDALYAPRRTVLDALLLEAAVSAGASVELGVTLSDLLRDDEGRVEGVMLDHDGSATPVRSRFVVGADGHRSTVARILGVPDQRPVPPMGAAVYGYYEGMPDAGFDARFGPGGYVTSVPTNDGMTLVSAGVPLEAFGPPEDVLDATVARVAPDIWASMQGGRRVERLRVMRGLPSFLRTPVGPGWLLVGDAGFTKDPISAHGISCALRDAELASDSILAVSEQPEAHQEIMGRYETVRDRFAIPLLEATTQLASFGWSNREASTLMRQLGRLTDAECEYLTTAPDTRAGKAA